MTDQRSTAAKCLHLSACSHVIHSDLLMRIEETMVDPISGTNVHAGGEAAQ